MQCTARAGAELGVETSFKRLKNTSPKVVQNMSMLNERYWNVRASFVSVDLCLYETVLTSRVNCL